MLFDFIFNECFRTNPNSKLQQAISFCLFPFGVAFLHLTCAFISDKTMSELFNFERDDGMEDISDALSGVLSGSSQADLDLDDIFRRVREAAGPDLPAYVQPLGVAAREELKRRPLELPGLKAIENEASAADGEKECIVCYDRAAKVVLSPCGHSCFCVTCTRTFTAEEHAKCPMCKVEVEGCVRMFAN